MDENVTIGRFPSPKVNSMIRVFISYSHDSDVHRDFVRGIADRLICDGVECILDQYINGFPPEGWLRWMENQIEIADFVLLICTETYLRRYQGKEIKGGKGVNFEGVVISQVLYDNYYLNAKFIPVISDNGSFDHVPLPLKRYSTYRLNDQYDDVYRILTGQAKYEPPEVGGIRQLSVTKNELAKRVFSDDLPTVEGELFGRSDELYLLNEALVDPDTHIVQFVASGGTGKTKLIRTWLDENDSKIDGLIAWSFYSQGSSEDKQISATPFFIQALKTLGSDKSISDFNTEDEKGEYIADLLHERRCLLVLDGLEPLQQVGRGMRGELKDRAIRKLLRCLASNHSCLCIVTTRLPVHELKGRKKVVQHDLQNLIPEDGVVLLRSFGVSGRDVEMLAAVEEYGCHALALHLLGNALATYLDGDIRKRDMLTELIGDFDGMERHAYKVMQAYQYWLKDTPELKLLYLLGLFDYPVDQEVLEVLWSAGIPGLTEGIEKKEWLVARRDLLEKFRMMSEHEGQEDLFDCHPLIREYFGSQFKENQIKVWQEAHAVLYDYYKGLPDKLWREDFPETLEDIQPLFRAVMHGCRAGEKLQELAYSEVFFRIKGFNIDGNFGAFSEYLALLVNFYSVLWSVPLNFFSTDKENLLNHTGFILRSLSRLTEALEPFEISLENAVANQNWESASVYGNNLSELRLTLGMIDQAVIVAQQAVKHADIHISFESIRSRFTLGECLLFSGKPDLAMACFNEAKSIDTRYSYRVKGKNYLSVSQKNKPFGLLAFKLCEALIDKKDYPAILEVYQESCNHSAKLSLKDNNLLYEATDWYLAAVLCVEGYTELGSEEELADFVMAVVEKFKLSGYSYYLPYALFLASKYNRVNHNFLNAHQNLQEIYEITEPSGMRLHTADYHLEMARLILAVEADQFQYFEVTSEREERTLPFIDQDETSWTLENHIREATKLIVDTGYHRRDVELLELQQQAGLTEIET